MSAKLTKLAKTQDGTERFFVVFFVAVVIFAVIVTRPSARVGVR